MKKGCINHEIINKRTRWGVIVLTGRKLDFITKFDSNPATPQRTQKGGKVKSSVCGNEYAESE